MIIIISEWKWIWEKNCYTIFILNLIIFRNLNFALCHRALKLKSCLIKVFSLLRSSLSQLVQLFQITCPHSLETKHKLCFRPFVPPGLQVAYSLTHSVYWAHCTAEAVGCLCRTDYGSYVTKTTVAATAAIYLRLATYCFLNAWLDYMYR